MEDKERRVHKKPYEKPSVVKLSREQAKLKLGGGPPAVFNSTAAESGGISGAVVDNISTSGQASSLYFSTLGNLNGACGTNPSGDKTACAVKRTQNGLQ
jgi:hypothetical protein